jgi:hypothetical protein
LEGTNGLCVETERVIDSNRPPSLVGHTLDEADGELLVQGANCQCHEEVSLATAIRGEYKLEVSVASREILQIGDRKSFDPVLHANREHREDLASGGDLSGGHAVLSQLNKQTMSDLLIHGP